jgi:hypothetical protein
MHGSVFKLLKRVPLMGGNFTMEGEGGRSIGKEEVSRIFTDYIIQGTGDVDGHGAC